MRRSSAWLSALALLTLPVAAGAQDAEDEFEWSTSTELSFVNTSGNASSSTLGLKGTLEGAGGGPNELGFEFGSVRASSDLTDRVAVGTPGDFTIVETVRSETTAERYYARGRYDRTFGAGFAFSGAGWERNTFAGVQNRFELVAGLGRTFVDAESGRFKADLGLTYTIQKDVDPAPGANEGFGGLQATLEGMRALSESSEIRSELVVNGNLEETEDVRANWMNSLSVAINSTLALKTSVQLLWDNVPALLSVPLRSEAGVPLGIDVLTPSQELDSVVTVALVITL